jgi:hypothetical protein
LETSAGKKTPRDSLPSPAWFAAQVKKISDFDLRWLRTREADLDEDPEYTADPRGVVMRRVARAVEETLKVARELGSLDEIARLRDVARRVRQQPSIGYVGKEPGEQEIFLWFWSWHLCGRVAEAGEKTAFINLPHAFQFSPIFFLGQWWVRFLVHSMWQQGEKKNIELLLFGKKRMDPRMTDAAQLERIRRDYFVRERIQELKAQGVKSWYKAEHIVASETGLDWKTVKKIRLGSRDTRDREPVLEIPETGNRFPERPL